MIREFALPDLGEGLTESEIVAWHVAVGDTVSLNQPLASVETAKAIVELPSPYSGVVTELFAEPGATVNVGARIVAFELGGAESFGAEPSGAESSGTEPAGAGPAAAPERNSVLVGYGPPVESGAHPKRKARRASGSGTSSEARPADPESAAEPETEAEPAQPHGSALPRDAVRDTESPAAPKPHGSSRAPSPRPAATPPVRKLAHDLGIDLATLSGTGENGLITRQDVQAAASASHQPDARPLGRERRTPIKGVRKATAAAMVSSAFTAPHVTEFLTVDVTRTRELLGRIAERGGKASMLAVIAKAVCLAAARTPSINSRWDAAANEIVEFGYVNLGIAVATERGLLVPVIPNADGLDLAALTSAISELASTARARQSAPEALSGGTFTISNVGVFGIDAGTPIINPGEAAILAVGAVRRQPWEYEGSVALREVCTLSLSFDHRLIDGEQGARFLVDVGAILSDPGTVLAMV